MSSKAIKGITVEIGGDTTKLGKSLENSEKKSRSLQTELREVQNALKFDPTNVELLSQKQAILTQNVEETEKKLDTLKEAEKQVIAQFERGEIAEEQVRALKREIIKTEDVLDSMKSEVSTTEKALKDLADGTDNANKHTKEYKDSVEKAKKELEDFGDKAKESFDKVKTGVGVLGGAVVAGAGYALKLSTDFDQAFNTLIAKTGASKDEFDELNQAMENVYSNNFGESIEDVAESMATVRNNTKLTGEELQNVTEYALLLRDTFDFDVNESTRSAKMLMDQFGVSAEEAYNYIAIGAQNGLDKNGDLLDTINEYSVHFNQLGLTADDMFTMLVGGAESGTFSVDKLGDAVKEFGIRAKDGSDSSREAFEYLGYDADKLFKIFNEGGETAAGMTKLLIDELTGMPDSVEKTTAGVALFGTMWEDLGAEGIKALSGLDNELDTTRDALGEINAQKYDDIGSALQGLGRTLETEIAEPLGEELKPIVEEAIGYVKENGPEIKEVIGNIVSKIGEFVGFIVDNGATILSVIGGIGTGLLVWNVVSMITGVVNAIKAFKLANEGATIAQWAMNVAMNANPIGIIIALIAGLVTAFVLLWNNCEGFRNFWIGLWEKIKAVFSTVVEWFSTTIPKIGEFFVNLWNGIVNVFSSVGEWFNTNVIQPIVNVFTNIVTWVKDNIITPISTFYETWIAPVINKIVEMVKKLIEIVGALFVGLWNLLNENVIQPIVNAFKELWTKVSEFFTNLWNDIVAIWTTVATWFDTNVIQPIVGFFKDVWSKISEGATTAWNSVTSVFGVVKTWFKDTITEAWTAVKNVFSSWGSFFGGLWTTIKDKFSTIGTNIADAISGAVKSGINGVISAIEGTINRGVGLINGAIDLINKLPGVSVGKINTLSLPRLARGGIVDSPTIAEIGEDGREAIIPLENNTEWIDNVARKLNDRLPTNMGADVALLKKLDSIYDRLNRLQVVLDNGVLVGEIIDDIDVGLAEKQLLTARGV